MLYGEIRDVSFFSLPLARTTPAFVVHPGIFLIPVTSIRLHLLIFLKLSGRAFCLLRSNFVAYNSKTFQLYWISQIKCIKSKHNPCYSLSL